MTYLEKIGLIVRAIITEQKREIKRIRKARDNLAHIQGTQQGDIIIIGMPIITIAVIIIAVAITTLWGAILLPTYRNTSINDSKNYANNNTSPVVGTLLDTIKAQDGDGLSIKNNSISKSATTTLLKYYPGGYSTRLECMIDSFPVYCDGGPISLYYLPAGKHTFVISELGNVQMRSASFSWVIIAK